MDPLRDSDRSTKTRTRYTIEVGGGRKPSSFTIYSCFRRDLKPVTNDVSIGRYGGDP